MKSRELKKMLPQLLMTALIGISSWMFTSIQDIKEHQGRCDAEVMNLKDNLDEVDEELDMLESNFNQLMFKLQG
jgi:hypothetical protein